MIKRLIVILITIISSQIYAQQGTASPYSFYGIGSLRYKGTVENRSMGGISVYMDSIYLNLRNPASYVGKNVEATPFDNESRPVKFSVGGSYTSTNLEANNGSAEASTSTFDYFALNLPLGKFGFGLAVLPFTSVGYKLEDINADGQINNRFSGEGGLNKVIAGFGYKISDKLSVGLDINYNFGNIQNSAINFQYNDGVLLQFQTRQNNRSDLSGANFNLGLAYKTNFTNKLDVTATATYSPESNLSSQNERSVSTITIDNNTGQEFVNNTIEEDLGSLETTDLKLPSRLSLGLGIGEQSHWFAGMEYTYQNTSAFSNPIFEAANSTFVNASKFAVGGFYVPNYNSFNNYLKRIVYRAGFRSENTGLEINGETINEFGMSFGIGLPMGASYNTINIGFEYGQRGTTSQNLIKEDFIALNISLSLTDRWFKKRQYN